MITEIMFINGFIIGCIFGTLFITICIKRNLIKAKRLRLNKVWYKLVKEENE